MSNPIKSYKMCKRNKQNVKINLNAYEEFTQGFEFVVIERKNQMKI